MKKLCLLLALMLAAALLALPAFADEPVVFLATGGSGDGSSAQAPLGSMNAAYAALGGGGGTIVVCGPYTLGNTATVNLPAHTGTVTVTSVFDNVDYRATNGAKLVFNGSSFVKLSGATVFDSVDMTLNQSAAGICANFHPLTITDSVTIVRPSAPSSYAMYLIIGTNGDTVNTLPAGQTLEVTVNGGKFINLTAFTRQIATTNLGTVILNIGGNADVRDLAGGSLSANSYAGSSVINLSDSAHVSTLYLGGYNSGGMKGNVTLNVSDSPDVTTIANHGAAFFPTGEKHLYTSGSTFMLPGGYMDIFDYVTADGVRIKPASQNPAIYVADGGEGDGTTAESPMGDFANAYAALSVDGGDLILVGDTTVSSAATLPDKGGDVRILSQNGARLSLNANLNFATNTLGAGVTFDLPIVSSGAAIFGGFHSVTFGEHTTVSGALDFFGGVDATDLESDGTAVAGLPYTLTVAGGTFRNFYGGNYRSDYIDPVGSIAAPLTVHVTGGVFTGEFGLSGMSILADDASLVIEGGVFSGDLFAQSGKGPVGAPASRTSALTMSNRTYYAQDGDITVTISGGSFAGGVFAAKNEVSYSQVLRGNYTLNITGGEFTSGAVLDATQVKAYADGDEVASLTYAGGYTFDIVRFDLVNGAVMEYDEPLRVAFVGDSITEGPRPNIHLNSYPAVFASIAAQENGDVIVANYGVASAGLLSTTSTVYFDRLAYPLVMEETDADLILIAIGTNDNAAGLDNALEAQYRERLYTLASDLGALPDTKKVYISNALTRQNENVAQIRVAGTVRPLQEQVAAELIAEDSTKFGFVDLYALTLPEAAAGGFFSSDNLHPSVAGYAKMGQIVYDALFDGLTPAAYKRTDVYLSASGSRYGAGTESDPTSALDVALSYLPSDTPATLHIVGNISYPANIQTKLGGGKLTVVGEGAGASLTINGGTQFKLYSDTEIENLTLTTTDAAYILGCYHNITLDDTVTLVGDWSFAGGYPAYSRDTAATVSAANDFAVSIHAVGRLKNFTLGNLRVEDTAPFGTYSGDAVASVGATCQTGGAGSTVYGAVGQNYLSGSIDLSLYNGAGIGEYALPGTVTAPATYDAANNTGMVLLTAAELEDPIYPNVIFLCDGGDGDGMRASTPTGSISAAFAALPNGGTIVICGPYTVGNTSAVTLPAAGGTVTLTSVFADVDYRATNGAKLVFNGTSFLKLSSATVFDAITMSMDQSAAGICANFHPVTFTESVSIVRTSGTAGYFMYFVIGTTGDTANSLPEGQVLEVTINGGKFLNTFSFTRNIAATNRGTVVLNIGGVADVRDLYGGPGGNTNSYGGSFVLNLTGNARVTNFYLGGNNSGGLKGDAVVNIADNASIGALTNYGAGYFPAGTKYLNLFTSSATLPASFADRFDEVTAPADHANVKFVKAGATGSGASPFDPIGSIADAYTLLPSGGSVVVMDGVNFANTSTVQLPAHTGTVKLTSRYGGMDFRVLRGAAIGFDGTAFVCFNGDSLIDDVTLNVGAVSEGFCFNFHNAEIGDGAQIVEESGWHMIVLAGANDNPNIPPLASGESVTLTVRSGRYHTVSGFTRRMTDISHEGTVTVNFGGDAVIDAYCVGPISTGARGGEAIVNLTDSAIVNKMYLGGYQCGAMNGDVTVNIDGTARIGSFLTYGDEYFPQSEKTLNILNIHTTLPSNYPEVFDHVTTVLSLNRAILPLPADAPASSLRTHLLIDGRTESCTVADGDGTVTVDFESVLSEVTITLTYDLGATLRRIEYTVEIENGVATVTLAGDRTYDRSTVYIADGGSGDGLTGASPLATIEAACAFLGNAGGKIVVCGRLTMVKYTIPAHTGTLTFTSVEGGVDYRTRGADLYYPVSSALTLGGETVFCDITFDFITNGLISAAYHPVTFDAGIQMNYDWQENDEAGLYLVGGYNTGSIPLSPDYSQNSSITVRSGSISRIFGFSRYVGNVDQTGTANITLDGSAHVRYLIAGATGGSAVSNNANVTVSGGAILETFYLGGLAKENYMYGETHVDITGITTGTIYEFDGISLYAMVNGTDTLVYAPATVPDGVLELAELAWFDNILSTCDVAGAHSFDAPYANPFDPTVQIHTCALCGYTTTLEATSSAGVHGVVYVADGGFGDGATPTLPIGDLEAAFNALGEDGGVIVVVRPTTIPKNWTYKHGSDPAFFQEPKHTGQVKITSVYDGVDYRALGAKLVFDGLMDYKLAGPVLFDDINFDTTDPTKENTIAARYNKLTFGKGVRMLRTFAADAYKLNVYGGYKYFRYTDFADVDIEDEWLLLCNHAVELKESPTDLAPINIGNTVLRAEAAAAFNALWDEMAASGMKLPIVSSAYQTYEWKYDFFANFLGNTRVNHPDWSYERAYIYVTKSCGLPHKSEHRLGVAVDMYDNTINSANPNHDYNTTAEWDWLVNQGGAEKYGIILHYRDNEYCAPVTGFISEAWHFRYIGLDHARAFNASGYPIFEYYIGDCCGLFDQNSDVTISGGSFYRVSGDSTECPGITFRGQKSVSLTGPADYQFIEDVSSVTGDANGDGRTSVADVIRILKGLADNTVFLHPSADISGDGEVTLLDALLVLRNILG